MNDVAAPSVVRACLFALCPRCGAGKLFQGYLSVAKRCPACSLDYAMFDPGDGPAVFGILIGGALAAGGALILEFRYHPPYWLHAVIWPPFIAVLLLVLLRLIKSTLLVLQYAHQAREGRIEQ